MLDLARNAIGKALLLADRLTAPTPLKRSPADQAVVDEACRSLALYDFEGCPFCIKVRREIRRLNLPIPRGRLWANPLSRTTP